jgi:hypothetical protein
MYVWVLEAQQQLSIQLRCSLTQSFVHRPSILRLLALADLTRQPCFIPPVLHCFQAWETGGKSMPFDRAP